MTRLGALLLPLVAALGCGGDDDRPVSWAYIHAAIIKPNCATSGCHTGFAPPKDVNLEDRDRARVDLMKGPTGIALLRGQMGGLPRMPPDQPLPDADIDLIERWIDMGFPDN